MVQKILESIHIDISDAGIPQIAIYDVKLREDKRSSTLYKQGWVVIVYIEARSLEDIDLIRNYSEGYPSS